MTTARELAERLQDFICNTVLPSYDIFIDVGNNDPELHDAIRIFIEAAQPVPGAVSNAMVERAWRELVPGNLSVISITKDDLRAALEAAVQSPPAGGRVRGLDVFRAIYDPGILAGPKGDRSLTQWQTDAVCAALSSLAPVEVATEPVAVLDIAKIVDPHPFLPGPAHEEDWAEDMVRQSQELALSKARRILAFLSRGADPLYVHPTGDSGALREALAEFLCGEFDHDFNPVVGAQWPEHADDDGYRGDRAYVRLQPSDVQARARENAQRILTFLSQRAALSKGEPGK